MAALYSAGVGTPKNIKKGISLYEELAKEGDFEIQLQLGSIYYYGLFGVEIDKEKGMKLIENCAKNGYDLAQMTLANILYENLEELTLLNSNLCNCFYFVYFRKLNNLKIIGCKLDNLEVIERLKHNLSNKIKISYSTKRYYKIG